MRRLPFVVLVAAITGLVLSLTVFSPSTSVSVTVTAKPVVRPMASETIYIVNRDRVDFTNKQVRRSIPAWQQAANHEFASFWGTPQVRIRLVNRIPKHGVVAIFQKSGSVQEALAYHTVVRGQPRIVVYSGTNRYYGYSVSVSFTHELFELLADPTTSQFNLPWKKPPYITVGDSTEPMPFDAVFLNEVCDPVEAYAYRLHGVSISDFITPNWFGDGMRGPVDYMNVASSPYTVAFGGYAVFFLDGHYHAIQNFFRAGRDPQGFYKGEKGVTLSS